MLAESAIQKIGYQTLTAASTEEALAVLAEQPVDLMFVDLSMEGDAEAGLKLAKAAIEQTPDLPVLYTTGRGITDGMRALFVEKSGFLAKPYTINDLRTALRISLPHNQRTTRASGPAP